jgi:O-antigen/teichoic acid export membrane protein
VLVILAAAGVAAAPVAALMAVLNGSGHVRLVVSVAAAEVTVNIVLSVILIETVGLVGAALGTLVSIALVRLPGIMIFGSRAAGIGVGQVLRRAVLPHVAPAIGCVAVLFALRPLIGHSLVLVVIAALAGVAAYLVLYVLVAAPAAERRRIFDAAGSLRKSLLRRADAA